MVSLHWQLLRGTVRLSVRVVGDVEIPSVYRLASKPIFVAQLGEVRVAF